MGDPMQLARLGDVQAIRKLLDTGQITANHQDDEGITLLHVRHPNLQVDSADNLVQWAAINEQYTACEYLLARGADVNAKGGEAVATPAMWAAQRCNYYVVHLLLQHGADPSLTDAQGYNLLHLATFDGNAYLLILLLHHNLQVDSPDPQGHTCLMWAAYKGYPACVELFLRWGANVGATDSNGFTALHWALVRGSQPCVDTLVDFGADRFAKSLDGKTPFSVATEMKSVHVWQKSLIGHGYDISGNPTQSTSAAAIFTRPMNVGRVFFFLPFPLIIIVLLAFSASFLYAGLPTFIGILLCFHFLGRQLAAYAPPQLKRIHQTVRAPLEVG